VNDLEDRMLDLALEEIVGGAAPPDLSERVARAAQELIAAKPAPPPSRLLPFLYLAASLLAGALILWKTTTPIPPPSPERLPISKGPKETPPPLQDPATLQLLSDELEKESREGDPDPLNRAEAFLKVDGTDDQVDRALFKAGLCLRQDAFAKWAASPKDATAKRELSCAEDAFVKVLTRPGVRLKLTLLAGFELAVLCLHEANPQPARALELLDECDRRAGPGDPWLAKVWVFQIRCHLEARRLAAAIPILDRLLDRYPESPVVARASKSVAIKLDEVTGELIHDKADRAVIVRNLRKVSRYYSTWLNLGPVNGMKITTADLLSVAETLYMNARVINGLDENTTSFLDLRGRKLEEPVYFGDAAVAHEILLSAGNGRPARESLAIAARRARCLSFAAQDAPGWRAARDAYRELMKSFKFVQPNGLIDPAVAGVHRELLGHYVELGYVLLELGKSGPGERLALDEAATVFSNVLRVVQGDSELWWMSRYNVLAILYERGEQSDLKLAKVGLENLERNNPNFDGGRFGMRGRFLDLKQKIAEALQK